MVRNGEKGGVGLGRLAGSYINERLIALAVVYKGSWVLCCVL